MRDVRRGLLAVRLLIGSIVSFVGDGVQVIVQKIGVKALSEQVGRRLLRDGQARKVLVKGGGRVIMVDRVVVKDCGVGRVWPRGADGV